MEKATEVYNKLKLQFVGKMETNKPKPQEKGEEEDKTEPPNMGNLSRWLTVNTLSSSPSP